MTSRLTNDVITIRVLLINYSGVTQKNPPVKNCNFHSNGFYTVVWLYN